MGIVHTRVDERLIHGQVANMWTNSLKITRIMVVDDKAAGDDVVKMSLKLATPSGVALSVLSTARAVERISSNAYQGQRVMIVVKKIQTIVEMVKAGVELSKINLGNISYREGKKRVSAYVNLDRDELENLLWLKKRGVTIVIQLLPSSKEDDFGESIEKLLK